MAESVKGIDRIILFRPLAEEATESATKLAFQTDHSIGITNEGTSDETKDGRINSTGTPEYDFSMNSILARGDEAVDAIKDAVISGAKYGFWEIDRVEKGTGENAEKYKSTYYEGAFSGYSETNAVGGNVELTLDVNIDGVGQRGWATLTEEQAETVIYVFKDTTPYTEPVEGE